MKDFHDHLVTIAHISEKHAPYYVGWVRQAYELAGRPLDKPLPPEVENESLVKLEHHREEWQIKQARHALRLYRYFLSSQKTPDQSEPRKVDRHAWHEVEYHKGSDGHAKEVDSVAYQ